MNWDGTEEVLVRRRNVPIRQHSHCHRRTLRSCEWSSYEQVLLRTSLTTNKSYYEQGLDRRQSKVIHGDQNFFPVYEPDPEAMRAKYREAEEEARQHHYDATKEGEHQLLLRP